MDTAVFYTYHMGTQSSTNFSIHCKIKEELIVDYNFYTFVLYMHMQGLRSKPPLTRHLWLFLKVSLSLSVTMDKIFTTHYNTNFLCVRLQILCPSSPKCPSHPILKKHSFFLWMKT